MIKSLFKSAFCDKSIEEELEAIADAFYGMRLSFRPPTKY